MSISSIISLSILCVIVSITLIGRCIRYCNQNYQQF